VSTRLAIVVILAASQWGRSVWAQSARSAGTDGPFAPQNFSGEPMRAEDSPGTRALNLTFYNDPRGPELKPAPAPAGTVSVEQLQHPLSPKAAKLLERARNFSAMGLPGKAIAQLQAALKERSAIPYAHSMLGVEYLKTNQIPEAISELDQALKLLPRNVPDRSNLGYALFLSGDLDGAERETRKALELDRNNPKTGRVLSKILEARRRKARPQP
jgi:tetratricopeptide (TPR) repeat protein